MSATASNRRPLGETCRACGADDWYVRPQGRACAACQARLGREAWDRKRQAERRAGEGLCDACGALTHLNRDHDHRTGQLRGRLCRECNLALGHVHDHPPRLAALIKYLDKWGIA